MRPVKLRVINKREINSQILPYMRKITWLASNSPNWRNIPTRHLVRGLLQPYIKRVLSPPQKRYMLIFPKRKLPNFFDFFRKNKDKNKNKNLSNFSIEDPRLAPNLWTINCAIILIFLCDQDQLCKYCEPSIVTSH